MKSVPCSREPVARTGGSEQGTDTDCSSLVKQNATACHSDPALREKNPRICELKQCGKNAGMLRCAQHDRPKSGMKRI